MRIAILTNRFPPALDGVGDYSSHLANELQRKGHEVAVLCRQELALQKAGQHGQFDVPVVATIPEWNWRAIKPLCQFLDEQRPGMLLVQYVPNSFQQWAMPVFLPVLIALAKVRGIGISITFHEVCIGLRPWPLKYILVALVQRGVALVLTRQANQVITSIDLYKQVLEKFTNKPVQLIPVGSNIPVHLASPSALKSLRNDVAPDSEILISTFGLRSQDVLLTVFKLLLDKGINAHLLICGILNLSETQYSIYQELSNRITVTGFLPASEVYVYLRVSDVFFLPDPVNLKGEGGTCNKSTSLATALLAGLPVVGTRGHMNNKLLAEATGVALGNYNDPNELGNLLLKQLNNPQAGKKNYQFAQRHLAWSVIGQSYAEALNLQPS